MLREFGSANLFYAGEWLTGDARGVSITNSGGDIEGNFYVGGDLKNLLTSSSFGAFNDAGGPVPDYLSGFSMDVGGKLGYMGALDSYVGSNVYVSDTAAGNGTNIQENEDSRGVPPVNSGETYFEGFAGGVPSLGDTTAFNNDTFESARIHRHGAESRAGFGPSRRCGWIRRWA